MHKQPIMTNSVMQKLNNNVNCEGTTELNSKNVLLQQDGAPFQTAKHYQLLAERKVTFIEPAMWPANSPDLNLIDCAL